MEQISKLPVYAGTIPNKATQSDDEFANNIFGFLNYSGNSFVRDFNIIVDEFNTLSDEIQTAAQSASTNAGQAKTARDEAVGALATLTAGAIDNTNKANNKAYSNIKVDELLDALDLSDISETTTLKHFTATLLTKLNGIATNANNYSHPSTHDASMITESATKRFVSDTEKNSWNSKAPLSSPAFTNNPTAPTQTTGDNSTKLATTAYVDGKMVLGTAVDITGNAAIDFMNIPAWAKRITILLSGISLSGSSVEMIQVGSNSIQTTGYKGAVWNGSGSASLNSNGFKCVSSNLASDIKHIIMTLVKIKDHTWVASLSGGYENIYFATGGGSVALSGPLNRLRITSSNGIDQLDAGSVNIMYEG